MLPGFVEFPCLPPKPPPFLLLEKMWPEFLTLFEKKKTALVQNYNDFFQIIYIYVCLSPETLVHYVNIRFFYLRFNHFCSFFWATFPFLLWVYFKVMEPPFSHFILSDVCVCFRLPRSHCKNHVGDCEMYKLWSHYLLCFLGIGDLEGKIGQYFNDGYKDSRNTCPIIKRNVCRWLAMVGDAGTSDSQLEGRDPKVGHGTVFSGSQVFPKKHFYWKCTQQF